MFELLNNLNENELKIVNLMFDYSIIKTKGLKFQKDYIKSFIYNFIDKEAIITFNNHFKKLYLTANSDNYYFSFKNGFGLIMDLIDIFKISIDDVIDFNNKLLLSSGSNE